MKLKGLIIVIVVLIIVLSVGLVVLINNPGLFAVKTGADINKEANNAIENTAKQLENTAVKAFNNMYLVHIGREISKFDITMLESSIQNSNMNSENKVTLLFNNETFDMSKIDSNKKYIATAQYNSQGYINQININEK